MKKRRVWIIATLVFALAMAAIGFAALSVQQQNGPEEKDAHHYIGRGDIYYQDGEFVMALAGYQKALELEPENTAALHGKALSNSALGYQEDAIADYRVLAAALPQDAEIQLEYVNALITGDYLEEAKQTLEGLVKEFDNEKMNQLFAQMHLEAPVADLESGTYDAYQQVHLTADQPGTVIYYTLDGSEPDSRSSIYTENLIITAPDTTLKVKCINYLGYESEVAEYQYSVTVPVKELRFRGYSPLENAIRQSLKKNYREPVYNYEAAQITALYVIGEGFCENPETTVFYRNSYVPGSYISSFYERGRGDFSQLKDMPFLETLAISWQREVPLAAISQLPNLKNLSLLNDNIRDITPLAQLTGLEKLALGWNHIKNISALENMENLVSLGLWDNEIEDLTPVSNLTSLSYLDVANNRVSSLDAVSNLPDLREFWANGNEITSIMPLDPDGVLKVLMMADNPVEDFPQWKAAHPNMICTDLQ